MQKIKRFLLKQSQSIRNPADSNMQGHEVHMEALSPELPWIKRSH
jgi:hypothetical protein